MSLKFLTESRLQTADRAIAELINAEVARQSETTGARPPGRRMLTVPRHTPVEDVRIVMTASIFSQATFASDDISAAERAPSRFTVVNEIETPSATYTRTTPDA